MIPGLSVIKVPEPCLMINIFLEAKNLTASLIVFLPTSKILDKSNSLGSLSPAVKLCFSI